MLDNDTSATDSQIAAEQVIASAAVAIRTGQLVTFPTDTVYALACDWRNPAALAAMFAAKHRSSTKAIPVLVSTRAAVFQVGVGADPRVQRLMNAFWPGALTIVLPAHAGIPDAIRTVDQASRSTVAVRMPNHPTARAIIDRAGGAVAATSANRSGTLPAVSVAEIRATLGAAVAVVIGGEATLPNQASTIVRLEADDIAIVRVGGIAEETIRSVLANPLL